MDKKYIITDREPAALYHYLEDIMAIPRVSCNEAAAAAYVVSIAKSHNLWYYKDDVHNVLVRKPGSAGCDDLPFVLLTGHLDMVGEKEADSTHNFDTDPIKLIVNGNILHADKTTLGADNGCAIALMLKLLTDDTLVHPPLECLFTVQEEIGLMGARYFDASLLKSRRVIGLDAGSEGIFRMGTSTKFKMTSLFPVRRETVKGKTFRLLVDGLRGGDQGAGIPKERICAIKMTARILHHLYKELDVRIISMDKLGKGIPESCLSFIALAEGSEERLQAIIKEQQELICKEYRESDPEIRILAVPEKTNREMLVIEDSRRLSEAIYLMPYGARNRNLSHIDEVCCSVIIKKIYTKEDDIHIFTVISAEELAHGEALSEEMKTFMEYFGLLIENYEIESGWSWEMESPIRDTMVKAYEELFGRKPRVNISHGSNDCVILKEKIPEMDMITTAATYVDYHTPKERLYMDSFEQLCALLEKTLELLTE